MSLDYYVFIEMSGVMDIYYFNLEMQDPIESNYLEGVVTKIDTTYWKHEDFKVNCTVGSWHY